MSKIEIIEKDDHIVTLQHGTQTAEFSQLGNTFLAMLEQVHKWGQEEVIDETKTISKITPLLRNILHPTTHQKSNFPHTT